MCAYVTDVPRLIARAGVGFSVGMRFLVARLSVLPPLDAVHDGKRQNNQNTRRYPRHDPGQQCFGTEDRLAELPRAYFHAAGTEDPHETIPYQHQNGDQRQNA